LLLYYKRRGKNGRIFLVKNARPKKAVETISTILGQKKHKHYGLRVVTDLEQHFTPDYIKKKFPDYKFSKPKVGDIFPNSSKWVDGRISRRLSGTSALKITSETIDRVIKATSDYRYGAKYAVLLGSDSARKGVDTGEIVMKSAKTLAVFAVKKRLR
jgi:hypothetical protein